MKVQPQLDSRVCNERRKLTIRASSRKNLRGRNTNPYFDEETPSDKEITTRSKCTTA
ncbi:MAG: hypothetical protein MUF42_13865 [Cytophagaceae bacterium]|nr:hypothetical protein [Cytophagaceae bacterium]